MIKNRLPPLAQSSAGAVAQYSAGADKYMRSIFGIPIGRRPTRPLFGYSGSITAISLGHGTMRSISARNFSRRVRFFFIAYSALAKLRWLIVVLPSSADLIVNASPPVHDDRAVIDQRLLSCGIL